MARITNTSSFKNSFTISPHFSYSSFFFINYIRYLLGKYYKAQDLAIKGLGALSLAWVNNSLTVYIDLYDLSSLKIDKVILKTHLLPFLFFSRKMTASSFFPFSLPFNFIYTLRSSNEITAEVVVNYFKARVAQHSPILEIVAALHKLLSSTIGLHGYRLEITGRYARQQRASKLTIKRGLVSLSSNSSPILFYQDYLLLKHGKCGLKVWLNRKVTFNKNSSLYTISL